MTIGNMSLPFRRKLWKFFHTWLVFQLGPQRLQDHSLGAAEITKDALQLVSIRNGAPQPFDFPQQSAHVSRLVARSDRLEVGFCERWSDWHTKVLWF